jgi:hypothetical protein
MLLPRSRHTPVALDNVVTIAQRLLSSLPPIHYPPALAIREHRKSAIDFNYTQFGEQCPRKSHAPHLSVGWGAWYFQSVSPGRCTSVCVAERLTSSCFATCGTGFVPIRRMCLWVFACPCWEFQRVVFLSSVPSLRAAQPPWL